MLFRSVFDATGRSIPANMELWPGLLALALALNLLELVDPASTWPSREAYDRKYRALAARFIENFKLIKEGCPEHVADAGPAHVPGV